MSKFDWEKIRAEYAAGATQSELSRRHGVSRKAIQKHIAAEGWIQDVSGEVNRLAEAKVAGIVAGCDPLKKAAALNSAADKKASVIIRHQQEWEEHKKWVDEALNTGDFEAAKIAKITAETLRIRQEGERKAWGIVDQTQQKPQIDILPLYPAEKKE